MILSAIIIALIGLALACWFYWGMGYRDRTLLYGIAVIVFTGACIWTLININAIEVFLRAHLGVWGMSGVFLLIALTVWLCIKFLF